MRGGSMDQYVIHPPVVCVNEVHPGIYISYQSLARAWRWTWDQSVQQCLVSSCIAPKGTNQTHGVMGTVPVLHGSPCQAFIMKVHLYDTDSTELRRVIGMLSMLILGYLATNTVSSFINHLFFSSTFRVPHYLPGLPTLLQDLDCPMLRSHCINIRSYKIKIIQARASRRRSRGIDSFLQLRTLSHDITVTCVPKVTPLRLCQK